MIERAEHFGDVVIRDSSMIHPRFIRAPFGGAIFLHDESIALCADGPELIANPTPNWQPHRYVT